VEHRLSAPGERRNVADTSWTVCGDREAGYDIRIVEQVLSPGNPALADAIGVERACVTVIDDGLPANVRDQVEAYFLAKSISSRSITVTGGERVKEFSAIIDMLGAFERYGLKRATQPVVIVGGGAVLDAAGFAASIYRRGTPYIRIPTTLLAYVDASVGVKTGVNFGARKNLVGTFQPPQTTLLDSALFQTLPQAEIRSGLGEVLKLAVGCDADLFDALERSADKFEQRAFDDRDVRSVLRRSIDIMISELEPNLYEADLCRRVDLGHSFSQPLEIAGAALRHGDAVAVDILVTAIIARNCGALSADDLDRIWALAFRLGHPVEVADLKPEALWESIEERVRHRGGFQRLPVPSRIGDCDFVNDLDQASLFVALDEFRARAAGRR